MQQEGLHVHDVHLWRGDHQILDSVNFRAEPGQLVRIAGANGSGKTTLLRLLAGLSVPEEGKISWQGVSVADDPRAYREAAAFLGHKDSISDELTARENLRFGLALSGLPYDAAKCNEVLALLSISAQADRQVRTLSAGQRRRTALARIFLCPAIIWLLDEPYTHLDVEGRGALNDKIRAKLAGGGLVILSTHDDKSLPGPVAVEVML